MSKESYICGFCKAAEAYGVNPITLLKIANPAAFARAAKTVSPVLRKLISRLGPASKAVVKYPSKAEASAAGIPNGLKYSVVERTPLNQKAIDYMNMKARAGNREAVKRLSEYYPEEFKRIEFKDNIPTDYVNPFSSYLEEISNGSTYPSLKFTR